MDAPDKHGLKRSAILDELIIRVPERAETNTLSLISYIRISFTDYKKCKKGGGWVSTNLSCIHQTNIDGVLKKTVDTGQVSYRSVETQCLRLYCIASLLQWVSLV